MQVRDTPLLVNQAADTVTIAVGAGGSGVYYGPYRDKDALKSQGTLVAAGQTFSVTTPTWVVSQGGRDGTPGDVTIVSDSVPSQGSTTAVAQVPVGLFAGSKVVTSRGNSFGTSAGTTVATGRTCRTRHVVACAAGGIRLVFGNFNGILPGAQPLDVKAALELANGTILPVYFNGGIARTVSLQPGGLIVSDPLGVTFAGGDVVFSRTYVQPTGGTGTIPVESHNRGAAYGEGATTTNTDMTDSGVIGNAGTNLYGPVCILGAATFPADISSWGFAGDSQLNGTGDQTDEAVLDDSRGWGTRALAGLAGVARLTRAGLSTNQRVDPTRTSLHDFTLLGSCTHVLSNMGINDYRAARTKAQWQADLIAYCTRLKLRGAKVYQSTILPNTDSTDSWATTANQTIHLSAPLEQDRKDGNDWLRAGAPVTGTFGSQVAVAPGTPGAVTAGLAGHFLDGVFEAADLGETARNSGIWLANSTADGLHPNPALHATIAAAFQSFVRGQNIKLAA